MTTCSAGNAVPLTGHGVICQGLSRQLSGHHVRHSLMAWLASWWPRLRHLPPHRQLDLSAVVEVLPKCGRSAQQVKKVEVTQQR
jgi:hypothetical protein